jgi:hypothetical protein
MKDKIRLYRERIKDLEKKLTDANLDDSKNVEALRGMIELALKNNIDVGDIFQEIDKAEYWTNHSLRKML